MAKIDNDYFQVDENIKQNEIKDILTEDEEVLLTLKPQRKVYILEAIFKGLPIALLWAGFDVFFIIMMVNSGAFKAIPTAMVFIIIGFFLIHLIPVWLYIGQIMKKVGGYKNISYAFTDKRIIVRSGLIGIDFKYIYYYDISSVEVKVGIFDRMFKVGDVHIHGKDQVAVLDDIANPYAYSTKIQELVRDLKADMAFPNDLRPEENHGYNTKYKKGEDR